MRPTVSPCAVWIRRSVWIGVSCICVLGGYLTIRWGPLPHMAWTSTAQAAEPQHTHEGATHGAHGAHGTKGNDVDLAPFMIRNAYHFATLYHAARAERWELAAYQAEELEENLRKAVKVADPFAPFLKDFLKEHVRPLQRAVETRNATQFRTTFQAAVEGCNDCHKATQHGFITIPQEPPALSIFVLPPAGQ